MSRFYEEHGLLIVWILTILLGTGLLYWLTVSIAAHSNIFPDWCSTRVLAFHQALLVLLDAAVALVEKHMQWLGAFATLGTFAFGLVSGIRQARRQLPHRLVEFMKDQLTPVYDNSEALVAAVAYRSANVANRSPLYLKAPLERALDNLGCGWRPRRKNSLDHVVKEADTHIAVTERRLEYLKHIRSHAQLLRGAVQSFECIMHPCSPPQAAHFDRCAEADFTNAIQNETTKLAALELRGLLRSRLGNLDGALKDFEDLHDEANRTFCTLAAARALRLQSEVLFRQAEGTNSHLLRRARRSLNMGEELLKDGGRILGDADWLERARNREAYGMVQAAMAAITGSKAEQAERAFNAALGHYRNSRLATTADVERTEKRIAELRPQAKP